MAGLDQGVALLGPDEPKERSTHTGVFGSHYDEGRMTRISDPDPFWAFAAKKSIERYADIERESGIPFFTNSGYLGLGGLSDRHLGKSEAVGRDLGADVERLDAARVRDRFPFLSVDDEAEGLWEGANAGHVSPRAMVAAQTRAAAARGATIIDAEAKAIRPTAGHVEVVTSNGETLEAEQVLIATGAFTELCGLSQRTLRLRVFGRTVVLARIDEDLAEIFSAMPTMGHTGTGAYILPPIRYPDGHLYLKIGIGSVDDPEPRSLEDMKAWFRGHGSESNRVGFKEFLVDLMPPLADAGHWHTDTCAVTWTPSGLPIIDFVDTDRIAVAVGGNGKGAKSSDEIGRMAALMLTGAAWEGPVEANRMRISGSTP